MYFKGNCSICLRSVSIRIAIDIKTTFIFPTQWQGFELIVVILWIEFERSVKYDTKAVLHNIKAYIYLFFRLVSVCQIQCLSWGLHYIDAYRKWHGYKIKKNKHSRDKEQQKPKKNSVNYSNFTFVWMTGPFWYIRPKPFFISPNLSKQTFERVFFLCHRFNIFGKNRRLYYLAVLVSFLW